MIDLARVVPNEAQLTMPEVVTLAVLVRRTIAVEDRLLAAIQESADAETIRFQAAEVALLVGIYGKLRGLMVGRETV